MAAMFNDVGMAAACVLAATFAWAGAAKLSRPADTAGAFRDLGVAKAPALARIVPVVELLLAVGLLAAPRIGAAAATVMLAGFSMVLARAMGRGVEVPCACFGQAGAPPLSSVDLVRNAFLAALAGLALAAGLEPRVPSLAGVAVVAAAVLVEAALLNVLRHRSAKTGSTVSRMEKDGGHG